MTAIRAEPIIITGQTCLAVIPHVEADGTLYFETLSKVGSNSRLFPAETGERCESVMTTLNSCLATEVAEDSASFSWETLVGEHIFAMLARDDDNPDDRKRKHVKLAYLVETKGELRRSRNQPDGGDTLTPMERWEIQKLLDYMQLIDSEGRVTTPWMHIMSARAALVAMSHRHMEVYDRYSRLYVECTDWLEKRKVSEGEKEALRHYLSRRLR